MEKKKDNWEKIAVYISIISLAVATLSTSIIAFYSFQLTDKANDIADKSLQLQIMLNGYPTKITVSNPQTVVLIHDDSFFDNWASPSECHGWLNGTINIMTPYVGTVSLGKSNFSRSDDYSYLLPEKKNLTTVEFDYYRQAVNDEFNVGEGLTGYNFSLPLVASLYPNPEKLPTNSDSIFPIGYLLLEAKFVPRANSTIQSEYFWIDIFVDIKNYN